MSKIDLSIIIPSYNTKQVISECLDSILKFTKGIGYEIIVIDNGSKDGSTEFLKNYSKKHRQVTFIDAGENLGFGKANNLGVKQSVGDYLLFLNSDTLLFDDALSESIESIKAIKNLGVFSCKLLNSDRTTQPSGGHFPTLGNVFAWQLFVDDIPGIGPLIPSFHPQKSSYDRDQKLDWVTGAFLIVPRAVFEEVKGFDEKIFMYTEEMELCYRISKLGLKVVYAKSPSIVHLGGASGGSYLALTSEIKNMLYFWHKHKPLWQYPLVRFTFITGSLLRLLLFGIIKGDEKSKRTYLDAVKFLV